MSFQIEPLESRTLMAATGAIRGVLYADMNENKKHDAGERVLGGVTVGYLGHTTVTKADGSFLLKGLPVGQDQGWGATSDLGYADAGEVTTYDADVRIVAGQTTSVNAFVWPLFGVTFKLFNDLDADGARDSDEPALAGFPVDYDIRDAQDSNLDEAKDDARTNVTGRLDVRIHDFAHERRILLTPPDKWRFTGSQTESWGTRWYTRVTPVHKGTRVFNVGVTQQGAIRGQIWIDADDSGTWDPERYPPPKPAEDAMVGWRVYLDANGDGSWDSSERSALTDEFGWFDLGSVPAGANTYTVRFVTPADNTHPVAGAWVYRLKVRPGTIPIVGFRFH